MKIIARLTFKYPERTSIDMKITRRGFIAGSALAGAALFASSFSAPQQTVPAAIMKRFPFEVSVPERYTDIRKLGDLIGEGVVCLVPPNRNDKEAMEKFAAEQERFYVTTRATLANDANGDHKKLTYLGLYVNYGGDKGEVAVPGAHILGVTDLRGVSGISEAYFERHAPVSYMLKYGAATGHIPMHVYLTETAADRLRGSLLFRQNLMAHLSPTLPVTVLSNNSEQARFMRNEPCKTGLHEFFPENPSYNFRFNEKIFVPSE